MGGLSDRRRASMRTRNSSGSGSNILPIDDDSQRPPRRNSNMTGTRQRKKRVRDPIIGTLENENVNERVVEGHVEGDRNRKRVRADSSSAGEDQVPEMTNSENDRTVSMRISETATEQERSSILLSLDNMDEPRQSVNTLNGEIDEDLLTTPIATRRLQRSRNRASLSTGDSGSNRILLNPTRMNSSNRESGTIPIVEDTHRAAFNNIKALLLETQRDKRAYVATVISQRDKIDSLKRELQQKIIQVASLEAASAKSRSGSKCKRNIWSQDSLNNDGIGEYQGICLTLGRDATTNASYLVTESFIDSSNDGIRRRDWRSSASAVSLNTAKKAVQYVRLPNGTPAIPGCVMARALELKFFSSPFSGPSGFLRECLEKMLSGPVASYMSREEKKVCQSRIISHRPTVQKFRSIISDAVGNRKKIAKATYLRLLGYHNALKCSSRNDSISQQESRKREREIVLARCVKETGDGIINTNYWRTADWKTLCLDASDLQVDSNMKEGEQRLDENGIVDNWFLNEASRRAFLDLQGYQVSESANDFSSDVSVLTLARADAAITTMLKMITVGGRGGVRNNGFVESYRTLLPKAMDEIIKEIWMDLEENSEHELVPFIGNSKELEEDPYGNSLRDHTVVYKNSDDNFLYLLASSRYLKQQVCGWYGNVKDAHIGRCKEDDEKFIRITESMKFDDNEASDVDEHETVERNNSDRVDQEIPINMDDEVEDS